MHQVEYLHVETLYSTVTKLLVSWICANMHTSSPPDSQWLEIYIFLESYIRLHVADIVYYPAHACAAKGTVIMLGTYIDK